MTDKKIPCLIYDRIVGYYQITTGSNHGKREEINERLRYDANTKLPELIAKGE